MTIYKVDVDLTENRTWKKYSGWLGCALLRVKEGGTMFDSCRVMRTKHGVHIYFAGLTAYSAQLWWINLIECLLGSDINKQDYFFAEGDDILFAEKNGYKERLDKAKTKQVNRLIAAARAWDKYERIVLK